MKHDKYDRSYYDSWEPLSRKENILCWAVIAVGVSVWSGFFFVAGYSIGSGS